MGHLTSVNFRSNPMHNAMTSSHIIIVLVKPWNQLNFFPYQARPNFLNLSCKTPGQVKELKFALYQIPAMSTACIAHEPCTFCKKMKFLRKSAGCQLGLRKYKSSSRATYICVQLLNPSGRKWKRCLAYLENLTR